MLVYILPFFSNKLLLHIDLSMAKNCFDSLENCKDAEVIIYNQGSLSNSSLETFMKEYKFKYHIIGDGENIGIPLARNACLQYIWAYFPNVTHIAEIHLDMIFPPDWSDPLINYLNTTSEPCVCPRIVYYESEMAEKGFKVTGKDNIINFYGSLQEKIKILEDFKEDKIIEGFVHPIIHKAEALKEIHPYDPKFLQGKQGFEDDSILLGYNYYIGTKNKWRPKINFNSCVYHQTMAQRMQLNNINNEMEKNLNGLYAQYGAYGFKELYRIHNNELFNQLFNMSTVFAIFKY